MKLEDIKQFDKESLLKYLAYLQVCPENSCHLQTLQELQNKVLNNEPVFDNISIWTDLDDAQEGLFVENFICYSACQFRAFVSDATDKPWQICSIVDSLIRYKKITHKELYPVLFFLCLSDKITGRLGREYYELGNYFSIADIQLLDVDEKLINSLFFTVEELKLVGHQSISDLSFLGEYYSEDGCDVALMPLMKTESGLFLLSPNALMNCAWRELIKVLKRKMKDDEISSMHHALLSEEIHNHLAERWNTCFSLRGDNEYSAVFKLFHHRYFVVTVVAKNTKYLDIDIIESQGGLNIVDVSPHLKLMDEKLKDFDNEAEIVHIVIPVTIQNELAVMSSDAKNPVIMIQWQPLKTLLEKDDDNAMWLYYYALDRKETKVKIAPNAKEEDVVALYLKLNHSFYISDNSIGPQMAVLKQGYALPLLYDIKKRGNRHSVKDAPLNYVVTKDQDTPNALPIYESMGNDFDMMIGEFMISNIFIKLPKNTREVYPELHAVGRSLILWYYALEYVSGRPVLMRNVKLTVKREDCIKEGFQLGSDDMEGTGLLRISPNLLGNFDGHSIEKQLLEALLGYADRNGLVLNTCWQELTDKVFTTCPGGLIHRISDKDLLCDTTIGEGTHYVVDRRRKAMVIGELAEKFNHYDTGLLTREESKSLVNRMIHYLNNRITDILEEYDLEKFLSSMMILRDGVIFWSRTMTERYNYMTSFYHFLGTDDPVQEKRIHEFVETDLCTRCLVEYALMKCKRHGNKKIDLNIDKIEEMFALMSELINIGYLSDYYQSDTFQAVIEVLPNGRFAYPMNDENGLSKYAKLITLDRLEHPDVYETLNGLSKDLDISEYKALYENTFLSEFGVEFEQFSSITTAIIQHLQDNKKGDWIEEIRSFKSWVADEAKVEKSAVTAYIFAFSIRSDFADLTLFPMFKEHDTYPCRYKRKLGLIYRPLCVFQSGDKTKVSFSYRGFVQSQYNLLDNIRTSNYSSVSKVLGQCVGELNRKRGHSFETGVFEFFKKQPGLICHRSATISPKDNLCNKEKALGDIDLMIIDNASKRILLVEIKNYNECKTPWEAVINEKKMQGDMKKVVKRDVWAKANKDKFEFYAKSPTADYRIASIMLTYNMCATKVLSDDYKTDIPVVWVRDVIEQPMTVFNYGEYA